MTASPTATILMLAGVALVAWTSGRLAARRASAPPPSRAAVSTIRAPRRLARRGARARVGRDVRCPARGSLARRHPARRPVDG